MDLNSILNYEKQRKNLNIYLKKEVDLKISEIVILQIILEFNEKELSMNTLKLHMHIQNSEHYGEINSLIQKGYFKKERNILDERKVILKKIDLDRIESDFKKVSKMIYHM